jgi:hypothetical protein
LSHCHTLSGRRVVVAHPPSVAGMVLFVALLWLGMACAMLAPSRWPLPWTYAAYTWGLLLLALALPVHVQGDSPLVSIARYTLVAFPCYVWLAQISLRSRPLHYAMLAASAGGLLALSWLFARGAFIA